MTWCTLERSSSEDRNALERGLETLLSEAHSSLEQPAAKGPEPCYTGRSSALSDFSHLRIQIKTLDPARLQSSDHMDVSSLRFKAVVPLLEGVLKPACSRFGRSYVGDYLQRSQKADRTELAFTPGTHGFLYYNYHPPGYFPPLNEGHLRFRIAEKRPASFTHGTDLLYLSQGEPRSL
ncbi:hypothetical protein OF83DRAFT_1175769 [Amylostereum chailletii]|nr:hypothetical protein OF83DRAFT_1175769 [Amylostereum chailletii]